MIWWTIGACGIVMFVAEKMKPARSWPNARGWLGRAGAFTTVQAFVVFSLGHFWGGAWVRSGTWTVAEMHPAAASFTSFLVVTFVSYWQHRLKHAVPFLWNWLHQIHHSPTRLELVTSFYRNPVEITLNMVVINSILYMGLGADPRTAGEAVLLLGLADMFYHWNIRTPQWLGYIIQRPEAHCIHHCTGVHSYNFGDLPLWDILFGTFRNPENYSGAVGFAPGREERVMEMMTGNDMSDGRYLRR